MIHKMLSAFAEIGLFDQQQVNTIEFIFQCMRVSEVEIAGAKTEHPREARAIDAAFLHCRPTAPLMQKRNFELYRAHVREIIDRCRSGADVRAGTKAEVLAMMSEVSLATPLGDQPYLLFVRLFGEIYPQHVAKVGVKYTKDQEQWPGYTDELLHELSRKLRDERGIKPKKQKPQQEETHDQKVLSQKASRVSPRAQDGNGAHRSRRPRGRRTRPQDGRRARDVRRPT